MNRLRIATRRSRLAMWQAEHVAALLRGFHPDAEVSLVPLTTRGDRLLDAPLATVGGKGLFVKELETALLEDRADVAVHSMKDVPVDLPAGLHVPVVLERADPRDALVSRHYPSLDALPPGARVGSSSLRRKCQVHALRPDLELLDLRGNVDTRRRKLDAGEFEAIVLACAGLMRLGLENEIAQRLAVERMLPAIGQGVMGVECRRGDTEVEALLAPLHHADTATCLRAERALNRRLGGGCQVPIAGFAQLDSDTLRLRGLVASLDGRTVLRDEATAAAQDGERLGEQVAEALLARGAGVILEEAYALGAPGSA